MRPLCWPTGRALLPRLLLAASALPAPRLLLSLCCVSFFPPSPSLPFPPSSARS